MKIVKLETATEATPRDKILESLRTMVADIENGDIEPSHFIYFLGEEVDVGEQSAVSYIWDAIGLSYYETIGHLMAYVSKLTNP